MSEPQEAPKESTEAQVEPTIIDNVTTPTEDANSTPSKEPEDLIARATRFVQETKPVDKSDAEIDEQFWGDAELQKRLDSIEDPNMREQLKSLRKSLVSGANKKYEDLAHKIKEVQQSQTTPQNDKWTPERINQLMQDPEFVNAAQQVAGTPHSEDVDDDYLPDSVKQKLSKLEQMEQKLTSLESKHLQEWRTGEHQKLASKYGNYNPQKIDEITASVLEGKAQISLEDIYKASAHDDNVKRAYEMGRKDGQNGVADANQLHTLDSVNTKPLETVVPEKGESDKAFFMRSALSRLAQSKKKTAA